MGRWNDVAAFSGAAELRVVQFGDFGSGNVGFEHAWLRFICERILHWVRGSIQQCWCAVRYQLSRPVVYAIPEPKVACCNGP